MNINGFGLAQCANQPLFGMKGKLDAETSRRRKAWELDLEQQRQAKLASQLSTKAKDTFTSHAEPSTSVGISPTKRKEPMTKTITVESVPVIGQELVAAQKLAQTNRRIAKATKAAQDKHAQLQEQLDSALEALAQLGILGDFLKDSANKEVLLAATCYRSLPEDVTEAKEKSPELFSEEVQSRLSRLRVGVAKGVPIKALQQALPVIVEEPES